MKKNILKRKIPALCILAALVCVSGVLPQTASAGTGTAAAITCDEEDALSILEEMLSYDESARILVDGEVTDDAAALSVCENGITFLQYESEAEAEAAMDSFEKEGYGATQDGLLQMTVLDSDGDADTDSDEETAADSGTDTAEDTDTDTSDDTFSTYEAQAMNLECNAEGDEEVLVAIIDTGTNVQYLDTEQFVTGYNAEDGSSDVTDNTGHGTMTASIVSAYTGSNVSIMPVKVMDGESSSISFATLCAAFDYVLEQGADVVNMSLGIDVDSNDPNWRRQIRVYEQYFGSYIDNLTDAGITMVVAAGNSSVSTDYIFPAGYGDCWTVSSIGADGDSYAFSYFSNYGDIDFCAPGEGVTVTDMDGTVETNDGTSFSSPLIATVAAQLAGNGIDTNTERYEYLQTICLDLGSSGYDAYYGYGLPQMEHNYKIETTTATCQTEGDTTYTCACGETYSVTGETIDHILDDPVITDTDDGGQVWSYYCTMCGELIKEVTYTAEDLASDTEDTEDSDGQSDSGSIDGGSIGGGSTDSGSIGGGSTDSGSIGGGSTGGGSTGSGSAGSGSTGSGSAGSDSTGYTVPSSVTAASQVSLTGATMSEVAQTLAYVKGDGDLADSTFVSLRARAKKVTQTSVQVRWKQVSGAASYVVYGAKCGSSNKYKKIKKLTGTTLTVKKISGTKLKKGTYYKFIVVACDADGKVIETSKTIHAATKGGTKTNAKSIAVYKGGSKVTSLSIASGSTVKITTKITKQQPKKTIRNHRKVKYESSDTNVAKVNANGEITAKTKGTCYIYAYAQNGVFKRVKVTVN